MRFFFILRFTICTMEPFWLFKMSSIESLYLGTIHKRRRQFFRIFDTPLPHVGSFLVLSIVNFDQFLTPLPSQLPMSFMDGPLSSRGMNHKNMECSFIKLFNKLWILCLRNYVTKNRNHYRVIDKYVFVILHYDRNLQILSINFEAPFLS